MTPSELCHSSQTRRILSRDRFFSEKNQCAVSRVAGFFMYVAGRGRHFYSAPNEHECICLEWRIRGAGAALWNEACAERRALKV